MLYRRELRCTGAFVMRRGLGRVAWLAAMAVISLALLAPPALGQEAEEKPFEEPGIQYLDRHDPYIQSIAAAFIVLACLLIAFKNPHRTHLG
jgi:hypothetical protein